MRTEGQTDRHVEANSRFSQLCERTWKQPVYSWMLVLFWRKISFRNFNFRQMS